MLNQTHKIIVLLLSLAVIFVLLGWIISFNLTLSDENSVIDSTRAKTHSTTIVFEAEREVESSKKILVTDRFVGKLDKDADIIAISSSGDAYSVKSGVLLTSGMVISSNEEAYSIYRIDEPAKSVSSN